jgi:sec-independent protein translocase protein TatA
MRAFCDSFGPSYGPPKAAQAGLWWPLRAGVRRACYTGAGFDVVPRNLAHRPGGVKGRYPMWDSPMHLLIIAIVILVLFGGRKIPEVMKGLGQGVREFKEGMRGDQPSTPPSQPTNPPAATPPASAPTEEKK